MTATRVVGVVIGLGLMVGGGVSLFTVGSALGLLAMVIGLLTASLSTMG